jgi:hypothetical protein
MARQSELIAADEISLRFTFEGPTESLRKRSGQAFKKFVDLKSLSTPEAQVIRAGIAGGLPFNSLTSDLMLGCLPASQVCYGNCFAAKAAFESGYDFGRRVKNILNVEIFNNDLKSIPLEQGFLRNGWNSDPSWDWKTATELAGLIRQSGRLPVFITKCFRKFRDEQLVAMVDAKAEIRISVSAFDSQAQLRLRLQTAEDYRNAGGVAIPVIMTTKFAEQTNGARQDELVSYFVRNDYPLAENSLRISPETPVIESIDLRQCKLTADVGDYWAGRLYERFLVPTLTSVPNNYLGLQSAYLSKNDPEFLKSLWNDPVPSHTEVMSNVAYEKPSQCGVAMSWRPSIAKQENIG